jgi:hypothetical protein
VLKLLWYGNRCDHLVLFLVRCHAYTGVSLGDGQLSLYCLCVTVTASDIHLAARLKVRGSTPPLLNSSKTWGLIKRNDDLATLLITNARVRVKFLSQSQRRLLCNTICIHVDESKGHAQKKRGI